MTAAPKSPIKGKVGARSIDEEKESQDVYTGSNIRVSTVKDAVSTATQDCDAVEIINSIRQGKYRAVVEHIRKTYQDVMTQTNGVSKAAKLAVAAEKKKLPAVLWSGRFSRREDKAITCHSGLLCADLDSLGDALAEVRTKLLASPYLWAMFVSPTGDGLKCVFRVRPDAQAHQASFRAVAHHVRELTSVEVDKSCSNVSRLCFVSDDHEAFLNREAKELPGLAEPIKEPPPISVVSAIPAYQSGSLRQKIAQELFGEIEWTSDTVGFCQCPGKHLHTTPDGERDCKVYLDDAPTVFCFHNHCRDMLKEKEHELRSRIGKVEHKATTPSRESAATQLVKFADDFALFHDAQSNAFARLDVNGHVEIWPINSTRFRHLLAHLFYMRTHRAINRNALADAVSIIDARACHDGPGERVFLRVAPYGENILIDLCDSDWRVVEVSPTGWRVLEKSPVAFIRTGAMRSFPLPAPTKEGTITLLWDLLNVTPAQRPLVAGALLNYFHPHGPYFVVNFVGEQGSAKSCAAKILRTLVDPNEIPLRSPPRQERDLLVHASNNWCFVLDNLSWLPPWLSDAICRLATGGGHSARQLYTDNEEFTLSVKRPVILNGIGDVAERPDLAERALQIELETIPDDKRKSEKELWREFEAVRPVLFSGIINGLVCAIRELPNVKLDALPRMADAALWATAGETAFGWQRGTFIGAYLLNLNEGAIASVDSHPVGVTIRQLLEKEHEWSGEPAELLLALKELASDEMCRAKNWPQTPRVLSASLRRLAQALRRAGIEADFGKKGKRRHIRLCKRGNSASLASPASADSPDNDGSDAKDANLQPLHAERPSFDVHPKPTVATESCVMNPESLQNPDNEDLSRRHASPGVTVANEQGFTDDETEEDRFIAMAEAEGLL